MNGGSPGMEAWTREDDAERAMPIDLGSYGADGPVFSDHDAAADDPASPLPPALAGAAALVWIGGALWASQSEWRTLAAVQLVEFVAALAAVPALVGIAWLLLMRTSRAEARRFGRTAVAMQAQATALERTAATVSHTLAANRAAIAEQVELLAATSEAASGRFADLGRRLQQDVAAVDTHARGLAESTAGAEARFSTLLASLPRARAETEEAARLLERTGLSASEHAAALDARLSALAERGREADTVAGGAAQRLAAHLNRMEATSETAGARLESVTGAMSAQVDALLGRTADAVDEARKGIAAQGDAMLAMIGASQAALGNAARENADVLAARIATVEETIGRVAARLDVQRQAGSAMVGELDRGLAGVEGRMDALHRQGIERSQTLAASISALGGSADAMTEALRAGETMATRTIGTTESLLIALDAAAREIDETLPDALSRLDTRVAASRAAVSQAKPELLALVSAAESTHDAIEAIAGVIAEQRRTLDTLSSTLLDTLNAGRGKADQLGRMVDEAIGRTHRFAEEAAPQLIEALLRVRDTAGVAADRARETLASVIPEAARSLEAASADAMRRAAGDAVTAQVAALAQATDAAVVASQRATERLADHVREIADQTALVETRLEVARAEREEADGNTFARRASLLIESLNSASIDITKAFAPEVSDSAWAAYLKGDRGVFTRRAVRVLDTGDAREVTRLYDDNAVFREQVNRYIHDFEAMLRTILAQPDGSPLGVTLLSSDMGKLYVALAQAIERLR
jgi:DNA repair exonuclease SbcCD ATPase subunit